MLCYNTKILVQKILEFVQQNLCYFRRECCKKGARFFVFFNNVIVVKGGKTIRHPLYNCSSPQGANYHIR